ncbi:MAG: hypothetical protein ACPGLY_26170 [Rubripirellula sp.]
MPFFDECCVLIPASTLEDFPSDLSDSEARSLLAGWTVLWHPALLAAAEQIPAWYRADAPPDPIGSRLVTVPSPSQSLLPDGFEQRSSEQSEGCWVTGDDRESMLANLVEKFAQARQSADEGEPDNSADKSNQHPLLSLDPAFSQSTARLQGEERSIGVEDFYAAGYVALQVQVMTRRLRYTSNLDEIHLQTRLVAAAKAFVEGNGQAAIEALHDVFDSLAEERDHYFSSDPHLIDLNLCVGSTVDALLDSVAARVADIASEEAAAKDSAVDEATPPQSSGDGLATPLKLATPLNVLIDADTAMVLAGSSHPQRESFCRAVVDGHIGWAGGGPTGDVCLDAMTLGEAERVFVDAWHCTADAVGAPPSVYGRFRGTTPTDLTRTLATLGYRGVIPLDFASGTGYGDEAKVIMQSAGVEMEALTAKPLDASSDATFLTLGTKLGEAIDSGEIATGLLAHWPGKTCAAFDDLRCAASWSLVLGKFWKLDDYFTAGEHPYHHAATQSGSTASHELLERCVEQRLPNPISTLAEEFRSSVIEEQQQVLSGMTQLVTGDPSSDGDSDHAGDGADAAARSAFATAIGAKPVAGDRAAADAVLVINPHVGGVRHEVSFCGGSPPESKHLFAASRKDGQCTATVDIPGCGFVAVQGGAKGSQSSLAGLIQKKLLGGPKVIAEGDGLKNEFMEVAISQQSGGLAGVYSGGGRGNRMSLRLIRSRKGLETADETVMKCESFSASNSGSAAGQIETAGSIEDAKSGSVLATFRLTYTLRRGSRMLQIAGEVVPAAPITGAPWNEYLAARIAVASESAICRSLVRDKVHRARGRRVVAPLGVVIDEAERQTLVTGSGLAFFRRVGERFVDSLLQVENESCQHFALNLGFDVPNPVAAARALIIPPLDVVVEKKQAAAEIGWIVHASSKDLVLTTLHVARRRDGKLAAIVRVIQTKPQTIKSTLRFFRDVEFAMAIQGNDESAIEESVSGGDQEGESLACKGNAVTVPLAGHAVADLLVVFTTK